MIFGIINDDRLVEGTINSSCDTNKDDTDNAVKKRSYMFLGLFSMSMRAMFLDMFFSKPLQYSFSHHIQKEFISDNDM